MKLIIITGALGRQSEPITIEFDDSFSYHVEGDDGQVFFKGSMFGDGINGSPPTAIVGTSAFRPKVEIIGENHVYVQRGRPFSK